MPILVFTILAPTLAFYMYALAQFWAEFRRRRHGDVKVIELHDSRLLPADYEPFPESQWHLGGKTEPAILPAAAIRPFLIPGPLGREVVGGRRPQIPAARLRNLYVACGSPADIPALKRAAKG